MIFIVFFLFFFLEHPVYSLGIRTQSAMRWMVEDLRDQVFHNDDLLNKITPIFFVQANSYRDSLRQDLLDSSVSFLRSSLLSQNQLRICEGCFQPQIEKNEKNIQWRFGVLTRDVLQKEDIKVRGDAPAANSALFITESLSGLSYRLESLSDSSVIAAGSFHNDSSDQTRSQRQFDLRQNNLRRIRGESLFHAQIDFIAYPSQHLSVNFMEQWGFYNQYMTGLTFTFLQPLGGIGLVHYWVFPEISNVLIGGKALIKLQDLIKNQIQNSMADQNEVTYVSLQALAFTLQIFLPLATEVRNFGFLGFLNVDGAFGLGGGGVGVGLFF